MGTPRNSIFEWAPFILCCKLSEHPRIFVSRIDPYCVARCKQIEFEFSLSKDRRILPTSHLRWGFHNITDKRSVTTDQETVFGLLGIFMGLLIFYGFGKKFRMTPNIGRWQLG